MKLESTNIYLEIQGTKIKHPWKKYIEIPKANVEELRDLLNDYLEMDKKGKL